MSGARNVVVLDTTVISNFATTDSLELLGRSLPEVVVPEAVHKELRNGVTAGHSFLTRGVAFVDSDAVTVLSVDRGPVDDRLDVGEAAALALAGREEGVLATDDSSARAIARRRGVPITGSIGLLVRGIVRDELDVETADDWLKRWHEERNYYAPIDDIEEAVPGRSDGE